MTYTTIGARLAAAVAALCGHVAAGSAVLQQRPLGWSGELQMTRVQEPGAPEAAARRAKSLLWSDQSDVQELLSQPQPASAARRAGPRRGSRARLDSLLQRHAARVPYSPLLETRELEPLQFTAARQAQPPQRHGATAAALLQLPVRGALDESLVAVDSRFCDPPCDTERGICAIRSRFAWSGGGSPVCVCSDPSDPRACSSEGRSAGPLALLQQGWSQVPFFGLLRDLNTVWLTVVTATVGLFLLAACWLRRPSAKATVLGHAEETSLEAPFTSREEWVRMTARRAATKSKLAKVPQVVKDDSDEGEVDR